MLNKQLEQQYEGFQVQSASVALPDALVQRVESFASSHGWNRDEAFAALLEAGLDALASSFAEAGGPLDQMTDQERSQFRDARLAELTARHAVLNFQNYRLWQENQALDQNLRGLLPQFEAATERLHSLEREVLRLRKLVPQDQRQNGAAPLVTDESGQSSTERGDLDSRLRALFGKQE